MAKRVIQECDLTKQEYDPDETVVLVIKKKGKKGGRTYELSESAAAKLEQQLVAGSDSALKEGWYFANMGATSVVSVTVNEARPRRTLADLDDTTDDAKFVAEKQAELREAGILDDKREEPAESVISEVLEVPKNNGCRHINKGRVQTTLRNGRRSIYQLCVDCRAKIPLQTASEKQAFLNGKPDPDVNVRDLN